MAATAVGLEIGTHAVRAAEVSTGRDAPTLSRFGQVTLPIGAVRDGEVVDPAAVGASLRRLWAEGGFSSRDVVVGIGNQRVVVRQADLPEMNEADLRSALGFQAQELIPIPIEDAILDFQILEHFVGPEQEPMMRVLLVAAQKEMVRSLLAALSDAGLKPSSVDLVPFALMRSLGGTEPFLPDESPRTEAIVSVGAGVTNVVVHEMGVPRFVRMLIVGGDDVTRAIASQLHLDADAAEDLKRRADSRSSDPFEAEAARIASEHAVPMLEEIRGSLDYYLAQPDALPVGRVLVSGGGSMLLDLIARLESMLGIPVEPGHALEGVTVGNTGLAEGRLEAAEPLVAVPVGLALGALSGSRKTRRLSLLPREIDEARALRNQKLKAAGAVGVLALLLGVGWSSQGAKVDAQRKRAEVAEQQAAVLQKKVASLQSAATVDEQVVARERLVAAALKSDVDYPRLLQEVATVLPNDVWLTSFTSSGTNVNIAAQGVDHTSAARFLLRVSELPSLSDVWLPSSTKAAGPVKSATFSATATLTPKAQSGRVANYLGSDK